MQQLQMIFLYNSEIMNLLKHEKSVKSVKVT